MSNEVSIFCIDRLDLNFAQKPWAFADARRAEIDTYFTGLQRQKPAIWNGRVLLLHSHVIEGGVFRGSYLETDYASFAAWGHWGWPDARRRFPILPLRDRYPRFSRRAPSAW